MIIITIRRRTFFNYPFSVVEVLQSGVGGITVTGFYRLSILLLTVLTALIGYFQRNWIKAFLQFHVIGREMDVGLIQTRDRHLDIGSEGIDDDLRDSRGIKYTEIPAGSTATTKLTVERGTTELFLLVMRYDGNPRSRLVGNVRFKPMHWWIHTWPPDMFTTLSPRTAESAGTTDQRPSKTSLHTHDSLLVTGIERENDLGIADSNNPYEMTAYAPTAEKRYAHIRRGSIRCELDAYTAGHNIFTPIWVTVPESDQQPRWEVADSQKHELSIVIDPPHVPYHTRRTIELNVCEEVGTTFATTDASPTKPLIETMGPADETPTLAVVCCIHGDEICGKRAIEQLLSVGDNLEWNRAVKFILANPAAVEQGSRAIDTDLNRLFGQDDIEGDPLEATLKDEIEDELEGCQVLDLHSTDSTDEPFALIANPAETSLEVVEATGVVNNAVDISYVSGGLQTQVDGVTVECGLTSTESATATAYQVLRNFLIEMGALDGKSTTADPNWYTIVDEVPVDANFRFIRENFQPVAPGETFARADGTTLEANNQFTPVLMADATEGYHDILGYKAERSEPEFRKKDARTR
ncbi:succinylglutamate desuccinylase/aspartoacylase family protein [Haloarcula japonica]|uniref:succinylglutamate desuccinylase/aspartoacylase family protein n=1 Tax=Haloarcula japonica TaxID=29282 RepID=UPI0039F70873